MVGEKQKTGLWPHDINYISLAGALYVVGRQVSKPVPPLNLVGDFGGGTFL